MRVIESSAGELTTKQTRVINLLLTEATAKDAAAKAGIAEGTLYRWLSDPSFSALLRESRARVLEATLTSLQAASAEAVRALTEVMTDINAKGSERVSAARTILDLTLRAREIFDIEQRLRDLERASMRNYIGGKNEYRNEN